MLTSSSDATLRAAPLYPTIALDCGTQNLLHHPSLSSMGMPMGLRRFSGWSIPSDTQSGRLGQDYTA